MQRKSGDFSDQDLLELGERLDFGSSEIILSDPEHAHGQGRFKGVMGMRQVCKGVDLFANDFVALRTQLDTARMTGQFILRIPFQRMQIDASTDQAERIDVLPGQALAVEMSADFELQGQFVRDQSYRDVFLRVDASADLDATVLKQIETHRQENIFRVFAFDADLRDRAFNLLTARHDDCVLGLLADSVAMEILAFYLAAHPEHGPGETDHTQSKTAQRLDRIRDMMLDNPEKDHRLVVLAKEAGMSTSSLKSRFRERFGTSVIEYLRSVRLERARQGLLKEGWTVAEAAANVGYGHSSSFSKAFHKRYDIWPSETR